MGCAIVFGAISLWSHFHYSESDGVPASLLDRQFSPAELRADIDDLMATIRRVHPDATYNISAEELERAQATTKRAIDRPMTRREFFPVAARLAARLGDGHTGVGYPMAEIRRAMVDGKWFPLTASRLDERGFRVKSVHAEGCSIQPGDLVLSINGHSAVELCDEFTSWQSGEKLFYRRGRALRGWTIEMWLKGIEPPYRIEWRSEATGKTATATVEGVRWSVFERRRSAGSPPPADYTFRRLEGNVGYLDFRAMRDLGKFRRFLKKTFSAIDRRPVKGLIIDLRRNGGGSTELGEALLSYITEKPYRMMARMELRVSREKKAALKKMLPAWMRWMPLQWLHPLGREIWGTPDGQFIKWEGDLVRPGPNRLRYTGPVCVLIGERTFSSAQKLSNAIKDYKLATLIGSETGGNPNAFGELLTFRLPHTRLEAYVSTKRYVRANGDATWRRGILPDIEVRQTPQDARRGIDTVLDAARAWVEKQAGHDGDDGNG